VNGRRVVYTGGTFDLLHVGHIELLRGCRALAGFGGLVVASANTDEFVERYKGRRPTYPLAERLEILRSIRYVDVVVVNVGDEDSRPAIEASGATLLAIGDDWLDREAADPEARYRAQLGVSRDWLLERRLRIEYIPRTRGRASSEIRKEL
jgi:glycerol-3-phosphate cytidylyltransferase